MKPALSSRQNPKLKKWKALFEDAAARREEGLFILEGPKLAAEALRSRLKIREACAAEGFENDALLRQVAAKSVPLSRIAGPAFRKLSDTESQQGIFVAVELPKPRAQDLGFCVALDGIQDPGNLGMILRSACAAGATAILGKGCADPWSPKAVRAAAGAQVHLDLLQVGDLAAWIADFKGSAWALDAHGGTPLSQAKLSQPLCLVVGAEGQGLSPQVRKNCAKALHLEYPGPIESLNAGVSLAIALFEALRQKIILFEK